MELIFRNQKITLLRWESLNRFKVKLIFFSYFWLVVDASVRGLIYLLNMPGTRSYLFQNTFAKITYSATHHQITNFSWSLEENKYADIKYPINLKHPQKLLLMRILAYWNSLDSFSFSLFAILKCPCLS